MRSILSLAAVAALGLGLLATQPAMAWPNNNGPQDCGCGGIELEATNDAPVYAGQANLTAFNYKGEFVNAAVGAVQSLEIKDTNLSELPKLTATATNDAPVVAKQVNVTGFNAKTVFSNTAIGVQQSTLIKSGY